MRSRSRANGKRRPKKSSPHEKWIKYLIREFGAVRSTSSDLNKFMMVNYTDKIPPRMPAPGGPSKGANLTMTQFIRGSDMTLPTGSAIVGSLMRQSTASDAFAAWAFCLADIPNSASVGALFDQYRIDEIQFRLRSRNPAVFVSQQASPNYSTTTPLVVVDLDDNTAPTTLLELQQYDNCIQISAQDSIDVVLTPAVTTPVFSGGVFSGYKVEKGSDGWLDVANMSIPHYGVKAALPALVTSTTQRFDWDVEAIYKVSFKNVR